MWALAVDWERQREWVLLTDVRRDSAPPDGLGSRLSAVTGIGPLRFVDTMEVTAWEPPRRCVVRHTGRVVRGTAAFEVEPLPDGGARLVWTEWLLLPYGVLGWLGYCALRPLVVAGLRRSLDRFAALAAD